MNWGEVGRLARFLEVAPRTLCNWKLRYAAGERPRRPPGRPPHSAASHVRARRLVEHELDVQGWSAGEGPISRALEARDVPLRLVRSELRSLKAERRRRRRGKRRDIRTHVAVQARNAMWSVDGTHLGRDEHANEVIGEAARDVASTRTLGASIGPPPTSAEVAGLLEHVVRQRGSPPLVLARDNGGENQGDLVAWCERHRVVVLRNLPHTPEHNPWIEHGFGELKAETDLGRGVLIHDVEYVGREVRGAFVRLDNARLRATKGWKTARETDAALPEATARVSRTRFYNTARCAIALAVQNCQTVRERRLAEREAILKTLECYNLIQRTRGPAPNRPVKSEVVS